LNGWERGIDYPLSCCFFDQVKFVKQKIYDAYSIVSINILIAAGWHRFDLVPTFVFSESLYRQPSHLLHMHIHASWNAAQARPGPFMVSKTETFSQLTLATIGFRCRVDSRP